MRLLLHNISNHKNIDSEASIAKYIFKFQTFRIMHGLFEKVAILREIFVIE